VAEIVQLHYVERGEGLPVVLLHGFPFDHRIWEPAAEALSDTYRVIAPDLRGHGQSPAPEGVYTMDALAGDVLALLDELKIERAVWIGHSMGGYITMAALRIAPGRIAGVGLVATHPFADSPEKQRDRIASAKKALERGSEAVVSGMVNGLFAPGTDLESEPVQRIRQIMVNTPREGVAGALEAMAGRPDSVETLRDAAIPMVLIAGAQDQIVGPDMIETMAKTLPKLRRVPIDGAGHMPMIEQPDALTAALREFLQRNQNLISV
jgi:3-oxoadipate enol-lactonase